MFSATDIPVETIFGKIKKSSKIRQKRKTLISTITYFLSNSAKHFCLKGKLEIFLKFVFFPKNNVLTCLETREATHR